LHRQRLGNKNSLQIKADIMEQTKKQRPRKPAQPIKVASNTKSSPKGESGLKEANGALNGKLNR
jgi:hypothetical protein